MKNPIKYTGSKSDFSIYKEDNVFSITTILPYGPSVNTDIIIGLFLTFCKCCDVIVVFIRKREANACLIMLSTKQGSHWNHF